MNDKSLKFYLRNGNIIVVSYLSYADLTYVAEAFNKKEAIHVDHVHIAPDAVLYYEDY